MYGQELNKQCMFQLQCLSHALFVRTAVKNVHFASTMLCNVITKFTNPRSDTWVYGLSCYLAACNMFKKPNISSCDTLIFSFINSH